MQIPNSKSQIPTKYPFTKLILLNSVLFLTILLLPTSNADAQYYYVRDQKAIDSLKRLLESSKDYERVDQLNQVAEFLAKYDSKKFNRYLFEADSISNILNYKRGKGLVLYNLGYLAYLEGHYIDMINYFYQAINTLEEIGDKRNLARIKVRMTAALFYSGTDKDASERFILEAIDLYKEIGDIRGEAIARLFLAGGYLRFDRFEESLDYVFSYLDIVDSIGDDPIKIATAYAVVGDNFAFLGEYDKDKEYYLKSINAYDTANIEDLAVKAMIIGNLATLYYYKVGLLDSTIYYLKKAIGIENRIENVYGLMYDHLYVGRLYYKKDKNDLFLLHLDSALYYANILDSTGYFYGNDSLKNYIGHPEEIFFPIPKKRRRYYAWNAKNIIFRYLYEYFVQKDFYKRSSELIKPWLAVRDSLNAYQKNREQVEIQVRYETEKKDQQLNILSEENRFKELQLKQTRAFLIGLGAMVILLVVMGFLLIRQNKIKAQQKTIILEQKLLRSQMNPHFIFNSLSSIQGFMIEKDSKSASKYLSKFAKLVRNILDNSSEEYVSLDKEISTIENYLELQKVRYGDKFDYYIFVDEGLEAENVIIPPMLAQPFIENAIEHGIKHKQDKGNIAIRFTIRDNMLVFEVEDDGVGRAAARELEKTLKRDHRSMATSITQERLANLNRKLKKDISLEIMDLIDDENQGIGTRVIFGIPIT